MTIPKIIHQIWLGGKNIPNQFETLMDTWQKFHPDCVYILWTDDILQEFLNANFPQYIELFNNADFLIQKVDILKYLVLYEYGGLFVDIDYQCLKNVFELFTGSFCIGLEPDIHARKHGYTKFLGNAFIASVPKFFFVKTLIDNSFINLKNAVAYESKFYTIMNTTGPLMINKIYYSSINNKNLVVIDYNIIAPFTSYEIFEYQRLDIHQKSIFDKKIEHAYAIHYFTSLWL